MQSSAAANSAPHPFEAEAVVTQIERDWAARSLAGDVAGVLELYAPDALFFGSLPEFFNGREGIARYFAQVPLDAARTIEFTAREVRAIGQGAIASAAVVFFGLALPEGPATWCFGMSWTLARHGSAWQIVSHHASPRELAGAG